MYYLFVLGRFISVVLPRNISYSLAKFCAILHFYFCPNDRKYVLYNLSAIIGDRKERLRCAKRVFINFSYYLVDFLSFSKIDKGFVEKYIKVEGIHNLNKPLSEGKGVIVLSAHLGSYELGGVVTSLLGYPISVVALTHTDRRTNRLFNNQRRFFGIKVIPTSVAVKKCYQALKKGEFVAFLGDKDFSGNGLRTKMFSRSVCLPKGLAYFALKTGAYIVPAFVVRENKFNFKFILGEPLTNDLNDINDNSSKGDSNKDGRSESDQIKIIEHYVPVLERFIRKYPDQWFMFDKYWLDEPHEGQTSEVRGQASDEKNVSRHT
ncbi:MAG: lysophospholipid acyltransferase family protein [Candidatus Omnitrophota bacterium]